MKKFWLILGTSIFLAACTKGVDLKSGYSGNSQVPAADQKQGDTSKTGRISQSGEIYFINVVGQQPELIESYAVDLSEYVGQTVTITGQYSGDTLFVGNVE